MKRSIDNVYGSDDISRQAKIPNQQPESDTATSSCDEGQHAENAEVSQTALATSFAQQESVLREEQIESLKGFDKEVVGTVLDKITRDACKGHPGALNVISTELAKLNKEELKAIFQNTPHTLRNIAWAAGNGHPDALNAISGQLEKFSEGELKEIFQASPHTLNGIAWAAGNGHPDALNAISGQLEKFSEGELKEIFQASPRTLGHIALTAGRGHQYALNAISQELAKFDKDELKVIFQASPGTLNMIAFAAAKGHPDALNAISTKLRSFTKEELKGIFQRSQPTLNNIAVAACEGHPDALSAVFSPLDGITGYSPGVVDYITYLNRLMKKLLTLFKHRSRFLGLERAFCNLDETTFSRITTGVPSKIISPFKISISMYKKFMVIFNENASDQADMSQAEFQVQENRSVRLCRFINDNVLQRAIDQRSRESRVNFVKGLCDYLTMMSYHHFVLDLNKIYLTYQSGLNGFNTPGYADSVLGELHRNLACPSGTYFFQASPESDLVRDKRYKKAYDMLKSFNANLGLWIQFDRGRDPLSAQKTVVEHFKVFLRAYLNLNSLGDRTIDNDIDYDDINQVLKEKDWDAFVVCRDRFFVNELADTATSSGSFQPFSLGS